MRFKSSSQAIMWTICIVSLIIMIICFPLYSFCEAGIFNTLGITALTVFYHVGLRLFLGELLFPKLIPSDLNCGSKWFTPKAFEDKLYKALKVKRWKSRMPTYSPEEFSFRERSLAELVYASCKSEIIHWCNVVMSFVPLAFSLIFGDFYVFLITSVAAACFDLIFVIMQRYNRPRLVKLIQRKNRLKGSV